MTFCLFTGAVTSIADGKATIAFAEHKGAFVVSLCGELACANVVCVLCTIRLERSCE